MDNQKPATDFPPYSLCGSVPLWLIHNRTQRNVAKAADESVAAAMPPVLVYDGSCGFTQPGLSPDRSAPQKLVVCGDELLGSDGRTTRAIPGLRLGNSRNGNDSCFCMLRLPLALVDSNQVSYGSGGD